MGFDDGVQDDDDQVVEVLGHLWPVFEWFLDLEGYWEMTAPSDKNKKIKIPAKADIAAAAKLLRLKWTKQQYDLLKQMIKAVVKEFYR